MEVVIVALVIMGVVLAGTIVVLTNLHSQVEKLDSANIRLHWWAFGYDGTERKPRPYSAQWYLKRLGVIVGDPDSIQPHTRLELIERELGIEYEETPPSKWVAKKAKKR